MATLDSSTTLLLAHLHRGGTYAYYWSASEQKDERGTAAEKLTTWWPVGDPPAIPTNRGPYGWRHLYFGVHPTSEIPQERLGRNKQPYKPNPAKCRPVLDEIAAINCLFAEFDAKRFPDGKAGALAHIDALAHPPSAIIDSGGGYHCYWLLDTPHTLTDDDARDYARRLQYAWVLLVASDEDAKDLSRVLRIPGTKNYKEGYGPNYPTVTWIRCDLDLTYRLADLEQAARPFMADRASARHREANSSDTPLSEYDRVEAALQRIGPARWASYQGWIDIGMALHSWDSGHNGLSLWERYSRLKAPDKWEMGICETKWATFNPKDLTVGSIFHWADEDTPRVNVDTSTRRSAGAHLRPSNGMSVATEATAPEDMLPILLRATELHRIPPAISLIPDVLFVNTLHQFFGAPGSAKSFLLLDIACTVAQLYRVIYVAAEAIEDYEARVNAWATHHGRSVENLYFWREPLQLGNPASVQQFIAAASALQPAVVVLDPLADCMTGLDENVAGDMGVAIAALNEIRRTTHAAMAIVHHTGWNDERERGHSLLRGACRIVVKVEMRDDGLIRFSCVKKNQGAKFTPRLFRLIAAGTMGGVLPLPAGQVMVGRTKPTERMLKVMEALTTEPLRKGATHTQIQQDTQIAAGTLNRVLTALSEQGYISSTDKGRSTYYRLTDLGQDALDIAAEDTGSSGGRTLEEDGRRIGVDVNWIVRSSTDTGLVDAVLPSSSTVSSNGTAPLSLYPPKGGIGREQGVEESASTNGYRELGGYSGDVQPEDPPVDMHPIEVPPTTNGHKYGFDWGHVRQMYAAGDVAALRVHCSIYGRNFDDVLAQLDAESGHVPVEEDE